MSDRRPRTRREGVDNDGAAHVIQTGDHAHEYVDTSKVTAAEGLEKLAGADFVLGTAPNSAAISSTIGGLKPRGTLVLVAAPHEPLSVSAFGLLTGKTIAGWPSGTPIDSEETVAFAKLSGVKARVETFPFEKVEEAFTKVMANKIRFRAVMVP